VVPFEHILIKASIWIQKTHKLIVADCSHTYHRAVTIITHMISIAMDKKPL